jgi:kynurenine formamidase
MPDEVRTTLYDFDSDGFQAHLYQHVGQWGTHVDPPIHFVEHGRCLDEIHVSEMVLPLVVFDIRQYASRDPDYTLTRRDVVEWERRNGAIPEDSFVALRSGWSARWPDLDAMQNKDGAGVSHFPGWGVDALEFLCQERNIRACGHETTDTDPGFVISRDEFPAETYVLSQDRYQIEMLADLGELPEVGGIVVASFPKPRGGSGFPARVFAITPS